MSICYFKSVLKANFTAFLRCCTVFLNIFSAVSQLKKHNIDSVNECLVWLSLCLYCFLHLVHIFHSICTDLTYWLTHHLFLPVFSCCSPSQCLCEGHRALTVWSSLEQYVWYLLQLSQSGGKSGCSAPSGRRPVTSVISDSLWFAVAHGCWLSLICAKASCTEIIKSSSFTN